MTISTTEFEFVYDEIEFTRTATCSSNEVVVSASSSHVPSRCTFDNNYTSFDNDYTTFDIGVQLSWSGGTFTVAGTYHREFPNSTWTYLSIETPNETTTVNEYADVPASITAFISSTHQEEIFKPITYTVNTTETITTTDSKGKTTTSTVSHTYSISHKVCNQWDIYKSQMENLLARGKY